MRRAAVTVTEASALAFQADSRIVVAGLAPGDTNSLYLLRYIGDPPAVTTPPAPAPPPTTPTPPSPAPEACASDRTRPQLSIVSRQGKIHYGLGETAPCASVRPTPAG